MVVFFDIDGTIVDDETQIIPESTVEAVAALTQNGHLAVVNTGRPYGHIDPRVRAMAFGGWVCGCGMEIFLNGKWLFRKMPPEDVCAMTVQAVRDCGMSAIFEDREALYYDPDFCGHPMDQLEIVRLRKKGLTVEPLQTPRFMKFVTHDMPGCDRVEFLRRMEPHFTCTDRGGGMVEYVLRGCTKAVGMDHLLKAVGADPKDTLAIGDSTNDLPMFSRAARGVCMGGGMEELKAVSDYVTDTVLGDGIYKALRHYGLIG